MGHREPWSADHSVLAAGKSQRAAVDEDEPTVRHCIAADLDDPPIGARTFEAHFLVGVLDCTGRLCFKFGRTELASCGENTDILGIARSLCQKCVGEVDNPLEIEIPRGEPQLAVEHRYTVAHVVERDAQFGLALADLVKEPCIVHRDDCLRGEGPNKLY